MQEQIFKEKKKGCPWRHKGDHFFVCGGSFHPNRMNGLKQCTFKNCPIVFWVLEFRANGFI